MALRPTSAARAASLAAAIAQAATTGPTVTVACKLPNGMNLGKIHGPDQPDVVLRGTNHRFAVGGYGLTHNVDEAAFGKWMEDHKWLPAVKNDLIFAHAKPGHAKAMAAEMGPVIKSGMEPLDGEDPSRDERAAGDAVVEPTEDQVKATAKAKDAAAEEQEEALATVPEDEQ